MDLNYFIDEAKKLLDIERDAVLARRIGLSPQELNRARKSGQITTEALTTLAEKSGIEIERLMIAREASKAKEPGTKKVWESVLARVAMGVILTASSVNQITPSPSQVYDFSDKTGVKDYRKLRNRFSFNTLAVELALIFGTAARLFPRQPLLKFPVMH